MRIRSLAAAALVAVGSVVVPVVAASPAAAAAPTRTCVAKVSNARPTQNSTVTVSVSGLASGARVSTVAHYKTTNTAKSATATSKGTAAVAYKIGRATKNRKVPVTVSASKGTTRWACSTAFTPR